MVRGTRLGRAGCVALVAGAVLAPGAAEGAVQIGQTFTPTAQCGGPGTTVLQTGSPGGTHRAPSTGVITSWSFQAPTDSVPDLELKVAHHVTGNEFKIVGESPLVAAVTNALNTYEVQIPVHTGDVIGLFMPGGGRCTAFAIPEFVQHYRSDGDPAVGSSATYFTTGSVIVDVAATLETTPCKGRAPTIAGTAGSDTLSGTPGPDVIVALEGNDSVSGLGGDDVICGGRGKDLLRGGPGKDSLLGQAGRDKLNGGGGKDLCKGGGGRDAAGTCETQRSI